MLIATGTAKGKSRRLARCSDVSSVLNPPRRRDPRLAIEIVAAIKPPMTARKALAKEDDKDGFQTDPGTKGSHQFDVAAAASADQPQDKENAEAGAETGQRIAESGPAVANRVENECQEEGRNRPANSECYEFECPVPLRLR